MRVIIIFFIFLSVLSLSFAAADTIFFNPGGNINPNSYIDTGGAEVSICVPLTCSIAGANCGSLSDGCGGVLDCGSCSSGFTCSSGTCVSSPISPGGGGGAVPENVTPTIIINPSEINLRMAVNTTIRQIVKITNNANSLQTFSISQENLTDMIIIRNNSISIAPGETQNLEFIFVASQNIGNFTGQIDIGSYHIPVTLNIQEKLLLFDSNIIVLNPGSKVAQGMKLNTRVALIPMGEKERTDIQLNYAIKDAEGNILFTHSETAMVEERTDLYRDFDTSNLPFGKYTIALQLVYPGGKAASNAQFEVVKITAESALGFAMFVLIFAMIFVLIIIVTWTIIARRKKNI